MTPTHKICADCREEKFKRIFPGGGEFCKACVKKDPARRKEVLIKRKVREFSDDDPISTLERKLIFDFMRQDLISLVTRAMNGEKI